MFLFLCIVAQNNTEQDITLPASLQIPIVCIKIYPTALANFLTRRVVSMSLYSFAEPIGATKSKTKVAFIAQNFHPN